MIVAGLIIAGEVVKNLAGNNGKIDRIMEKIDRMC